MNYLIVRILQERQKGRKGQEKGFIQLLTKQAPSSLGHQPQAEDPVHQAPGLAQGELGDNDSKYFPNIWAALVIVAGGKAPWAEYAAASLASTH